MIGYMKRHEHYVREMLEKGLDPEALKGLLEYHDKQILRMQHERLAHLIVTLFVCLFALLSLGFTVWMPTLPCFALAGLLVILAAAYIVHYYRIENGVQRWYGLSDQIRSTQQRT